MNERSMFRFWMRKKLGHSSFMFMRLNDRISLHNGGMTATEYLAKWCKEKDNA